LAYTRFRHLGNPPGQEGALAGVLEALKRRPGTARLAVQSLHVIAGDEYERLDTAARDFARETGIAVAVGGPLLGGARDAARVARAVRRAAGTLPPDTAAVWMGHGTTHEAQDLYRLLARELDAHAPGSSPNSPLIRLGVLEAADAAGPLNVRAIATDLRARGVKRVKLLPLLTVAGRHAHKDLAGNKPEAWKSVLEAHGLTCEADLAGLVERGEFEALWGERAADMLG